MNRRTVLAVAGAALAAPGILFAQSPGRSYRIAIFDDASKAARPHEWAIFQDRLRELGLVEGKSVLYERRFGRGQNELLPGLAAELVAARPDVIVSSEPPRPGQ